MIKTERLTSAGLLGSGSTVFTIKYTNDRMEAGQEGENI